MLFLDYELPAELIAQHPAERRDASRLMVLNRADDSINHRQFSDLPQLLRSGDLLIVNDTRVLPARLHGVRTATGGKWEGLFLRELDDGSWQMLSQTRGKLTDGEKVAVGNGSLTLIVRERMADGSRRMQPDTKESPSKILEQVGHIPLPPYIRKGVAEAPDAERYQTVFAEKSGAVAAPTAGLHFTEPLLEQIKARGVEQATVTLHVGWGTFQPMTEDDPADHTMHAEWGELSEATSQAIKKCRERGGRVVAVGTTSVRVLETAAQFGDKPWSGVTDLFIRAPYAFRAVDALITNFHLPRTTLLLMVGALAGCDLLRRGYAEAVREKYRFYSYGDAMLIV